MDPSSPPLTALPRALAAFQAQHHAAGRDGKGNYGSYTTLAGALAAVKPAIDHGLSHSQTLAPYTAELMILRTILFHSSGELIVSELPFPMKLEGRGNVMQSMGSAITYARRYSLLAIYGLAGDDDDAESTYAPPAQRSAPKPAPVAPPAVKPAPAPAAPPAVDDAIPADEIELLIASVRDLPASQVRHFTTEFRRAFNLPDRKPASEFIRTSAHRDWITNYLIQNTNAVPV